MSTRGDIRREHFEPASDTSCKLECNYMIVQHLCGLRAAGRMALQMLSCMAEEWRQVSVPLSYATEKENL